MGNGMGNRQLIAARRTKNDGFHARLSDVEKEMWHYQRFFKGQTVYCDCDDLYTDAFFSYFALNFNHLKLKRLICVCRRCDGFGPCRAEVTTMRDMTGDGSIGMDDVRSLFWHGVNRLTRLDGDGDFHSEECERLLDGADIIVTPPPFSRFREYLTLLLEHDKRFIIIGNKNAVAYKTVFPLLKEGRMRLGVTRPTKFTTDNGRTVALNNAYWYTNLAVEKHCRNLTFYRRYKGHEDEYPKYDNYDAIEVSKVADIPEDYDGVMGVPITFLDKYNPQQFELLGISGDLATPVTVDGKRMTGRFYLHGRRLYDRIVIRNRHPKGQS